MAVQPIPPGYHTVIPHLQIRGAAEAIEFYKRAFGATEVRRIPAHGDKLAHAEIRIGDSAVFLVDEFPEMGPSGSPESLGGTSVSMHLWSENADAQFKRAVNAGAKVVMPLQDMFWGDRYGVVSDPFGHHWSIATHQKDLTSEEIMSAMEAAGPPA